MRKEIEFIIIVGLKSNFAGSHVWSKLSLLGSVTAIEPQFVTCARKFSKFYYIIVEAFANYKNEY